MLLITIQKAKAVIGGIGHAGKMPCLTHGTSAKHCQTGAKLAKLEGSTCSECYCWDHEKQQGKGHYIYEVVEQAHENRREWYKREGYVEAFVRLLWNQTHFRWKDDGDVQEVAELLAMIAVANALPHVKFWLPTQERRYYHAVKHLIPSNMIVRISAIYRGKKEPGKYKNTSMVLLDHKVPKGVVECKSEQQGNKCLDCRACWNKRIKTIGYHAH